MGTLTLAQTGLKKDGPEHWRRTRAAFSLFFGKGPAKIKTLETLAESMRIRAYSNQDKANQYEKKSESLSDQPELSKGRSDFYFFKYLFNYYRCDAYSVFSFRLASRAQEKIGEIRGLTGDYRQASEAYGKALELGAYGRQSSSRERYLFGMECYYKGKHEATADVENSIFANPTGPYNTRASMISFAAGIMQQAFGVFMEAKETGWAIKAGKEAASLFAQIGDSRRALEILDKTAAYAKENFKDFELISIYSLAASITQDKEQAVAYEELAKTSAQS